MRVFPDVASPIPAASELRARTVEQSDTLRARTVEQFDTVQLARTAAIVPTYSVVGQRVYRRVSVAAAAITGAMDRGVRQIIAAQEKQ